MKLPYCGAEALHRSVRGSPGAARALGQDCATAAHACDRREWCGQIDLLGLITGDCPQCFSNDVTVFGHRRGSGESVWEIKRHLGLVSNDLHRRYTVSCDVSGGCLLGFHDSIGVVRSGIGFASSAGHESGWRRWAWRQRRRSVSILELWRAASRVNCAERWSSRPCCWCLMSRPRVWTRLIGIVFWIYLSLRGASAQHAVVCEPPAGRASTALSASTFT